MASGRGTLAAGDLLIDTSTATSDHLTVGDPVPVNFALTGNSTMRIGGIFQTNSLVGSFLSASLLHLARSKPAARCRPLTTNGSPSVEGEVKRALRLTPTCRSSPGRIREGGGIAGRPVARHRLRPAGTGDPDALIGIVNTLMLSVFERTHEIGLLRAVGMKRRQIRAMIRSESVILAVFGAVSASSSGRRWASPSSPRCIRRGSPTPSCRGRAW